MKLKAERVEEAKTQELILKQNKELTATNSEKDKIIDHKETLIEQGKKKVSEQQTENDELKSRIAELESMLEKDNGHRVMMNNINSQKKVTRDALAYVAESKRDQSIVATP